MAAFLDELSGSLARLREAGLTRDLRTVSSKQGAEIQLDGKPVLNACSNDYLGLAAHPDVIAASRAAAETWGAGAGAARLIVGNMGPHAELEREIASFLGAEALLFSSGYHANLGAIPALAGPEDLIVSDQLNHASLIDGSRLSRAEVGVYPHGDIDAVERALSRSAGRGIRRRIIVTESLFSMDGDLARLSDLYDIAKRYDAFLYVDEAHALGVLGPEGKGACAAAGIPAGDPHLVRMGTLGKAFGSYGAFIAAAPEVIEWLRSRARSFIFTTATPPSAAAAGLEAIRVARREPERRIGLLKRSAALRAMLSAQGWEIGKACAQIVPLIVGEAAATMEASRALLAAGVHCQGIRPPTVPAGTCRLRLSLTAAHTDEHLVTLARVLDEVGRSLRPVAAAAGEKA